MAVQHAGCARSEVLVGSSAVAGLGGLVAADLDVEQGCGAGEDAEGDQDDAQGQQAQTLERLLVKIRQCVWVNEDKFDLRQYEAGDEAAWLRCRVLGFLGTAYFDDVLTAKPVYDDAIQLVAVDGTAVVGLLDVAIEGAAATIETIAVDPTRFRSGVGSALLREARTQLPATVHTLDAWTRDDDQANGWYQANGFTETFRYLHVYTASSEETAAAITGTNHAMVLVKGFFHAPIEAEALLRKSFERIHICRRYELALGSGEKAVTA